MAYCCNMYTLNYLVFYCIVLDKLDARSSSLYDRSIELAFILLLLHDTYHPSPRMAHHVPRRQ